MKIGILTVYDAMNNGSFLQAFSLQELLRGMGHEVGFIQNNGVGKRYLFAALRNKKFWVNGHSFLTFLRMQKEWQLLNLWKKPVEDLDAVVIGSDEVWNLHNPSFRHIPAYFSLGLDSAKRIAYAPSFGNVELGDLRESHDVQAGLAHFDALSARDGNTAAIVRALTGKDVPLVLDPTLLFDLAPYIKSTPAGRYVFAYYFLRKGSGAQIEAIKRYAGKYGRKTVAGGIKNIHFWCDENKVASPFEVLGLIANADFVITNTFHGTLFSILLKKQFGVFGSNVLKVRSLLQMFDLGDRELAGQADLSAVLDAPIDYGKVDQLLAGMRSSSYRFLQDALKANGN